MEDRMEELMELSKSELLDMARDMDLSGYSDLNKEPLAELIASADAGEEPSGDEEEGVVSFSTRQPVELHVRNTGGREVRLSGVDHEVPEDMQEEVERLLVDAYGEGILA